ncbi:MAG: 4-(cytidine 5'-diphospho)-2-C-methyl-D-erythritol kinase [Flavobacteriales bacterium]|nr:4-(cytidine 5'-diphospho)-2-C-methyl-D-erythritol kinase [Flavobacteriales bacterium]
MVVFPNIKINIGLYVTGKRPDGYHNIESVFYPVQWKESLELTDRDEAAWIHSDIVSKAESGKVRFMSYGMDIPGSADQNLCIKVYQRLEEWFNLPPVDIHLLKTIPIGAGLGGGSADAAYTLKALKEFFSLTLSDKEAMDILAEIGSDCPFFWKNAPMYVFGRGERMHSIDLDLSDYFALIVNPGIHISTKEAYAGVQPGPPPIDLTLLSTLDVADWKGVIQNDFEKSVFPNYPILGDIKAEMYSLGAAYASMTGSGSSVYGIFKEVPSLPAEWAGYAHWSGPLTL